MNSHSRLEGWRVEKYYTKLSGTLVKLELKKTLSHMDMS